MPRSKQKDTRDPSKLSGRPLSETLEPSILEIGSEEWVTSPDLVQDNLPFTPDIMYKVTTFLLANPNMNSSHLFRADILFDSLGVLKTPQEKERSFLGTEKEDGSGEIERVDPVPAKDVSGFELKRTVVRRFIPRNPNLDRPLEQTCHFYEATSASTTSARVNEKAEQPAPDSSLERFLVLYTPHVSEKEELPWYHPLLRSLAFLYDFRRDSAVSTSAEEEKQQGSGTLSLHFLPFPSEEPIPTRLERTLQALLTTQVRLARGTRPSTDPEGSNHNPSKDNIIPQHLIQNTYSRLKLKYASDLCRDWVEDTEPSKHVFEDLAITAFLIELWRDMYGVVPADEKTSEDDNEDKKTVREFPGFVDVACGNGVLVYVLLMEGYRGWGFDARRRKSWSIFPQWVQERLKESIYIPKPFADAATASGTEEILLDVGVETHTGMFDKDTFIISNHADELTVWTPLMAALANPESPLPFLAIPCCSHSLSGARYRYPPPKSTIKKAETGDHDEAADKSQHEDSGVEQNPQPASGDLKALRASKMQSHTDPGWSKSMYGSLTAKTMSIAEEVGYEVEKTLIRIPSTRNMGLIGGRRRTKEVWNPVGGAQQCQDSEKVLDPESLLETVMVVVKRECAREGGIELAARIWIERAKGLHKGQGKGNQKGEHGH